MSANETIVGNAAAHDALLRAINTGTVHHAWLLAGPEGIGKAMFARAVALRLLAQAQDASGLPAGLDVPPTHMAARLMASGAHPDYRELVRLPKDADKNGGAREKDGGKGEVELARSIRIDQVRKLISSFSTKPSLSSRRVVVIDSIDDVERPGAANALLKVLEEPPEGTIFLLVSHSPGRLLPTIRSRCRLLRFEALSTPEVESVLRRCLPEASETEIAMLARVSEGSPGRALRFAGLDLGALETELEALAERGDASNAIGLRLAGQLGGKSAQRRYEAFLERVPSFIAEHARALTGPALNNALQAYTDARDLAAVAMARSLDVGGTAFEMAGIVARLARFRGA